MTKDVQTNALSCNSCTFLDPFKKHFHPIFSKWFTRLRKKNVTFSCIGPPRPVPPDLGDADPNNGADYVVQSRLS